MAGRVKIGLFSILLALAAIIGLISKGAEAPKEVPTRFLVSIVDIPLGQGERIEEISIETWGVRLLAACHIPDDWEVTAGRFGLGGRLAGQPGHGASYIGTERMSELSDIALIELDGPVQPADKVVDNGVVPATFGGTVSISVPDVEEPRKHAFAYRNAKLTPALDCPGAKR